jgi:hypothetical protein
MIALALVSAALAAPPLDRTELASAEVDATALIERCRYASCPPDRRALGEAFLVRATAAAVLRGEIDSTAAANARFLAPDLAASWGSLLPGSDGGEPEAWVREWADPTPLGTSVPAPSVLPDRSAREHRPAPPPRAERQPPEHPLELRKDAPTSTRAGFSVAPQRGSTGGTLDGELRLQVAPAVGVVVAGSYGVGWSRLPEMTQQQLEVDIDRLRGQEGALRAGAGPRWTSDRGAELALFAYGHAESSAPSLATYQDFLSENLPIDPARVGLGGGLGAIGLYPLRRAPKVAFRGELGLESVKRRVLRDYVDPRREWPFEPVDDQTRDRAAGDVSQVRLALDAQWSPGDSGAIVSVGSGLLYSQRTEPPPDGMPDVRFAPELDFMPRVGAGWTF